MSRRGVVATGASESADARSCRDVACLCACGVGPCVRTVVSSRPPSVVDLAPRDAFVYRFVEAPVLLVTPLLLRKVSRLPTGCGRRSGGVAVEVGSSGPLLCKLGMMIRYAGRLVDGGPSEVLLSRLTR